MATLVLRDLAPGRTATLQLYVRGTNTTSGSLITGTSVGTTYSFVGVPATGDYDGQISGFTTPDGDRFPIRNAIGYPGVEWSVVEEIEPLPTVPNTCEITLRASRAGTQKQVRVRIVSLGSSGRLAERAFVNLAIDQDTDTNGLLIFRLPWSSTPGVGRYRVRLLDLETNEVLHDRVCTVPDEDTLEYEDLPGGNLPSGSEAFGLLIRELDGTPSGVISTLIVPDGSLEVTGGTATLTVGSGGGGGDGANLSVSTTSTTVTIASDTGTDATIATASGSAAGIMTAAQFTKLAAISGTNTGDQDLSGLQPLDSDLTAIAALTTTSFGRSLLTQADAAATRTTIGAGTSSFDGAYGSLSGTPSTFTPASHNHAASDINSGTLPVARGGTGVGTIGTPGQILQVNAGATALEFVTATGGGNAQTANPLSQFAATTSSQLAGVMTDETGSGALVFATSPTLVTPIIGTPTSGTLTNCTGLPTAGIVDAAVTLAKMANLAQDQFIGRTTASTGVPQTATITAAARTVLDDTTVAAMVDTLGGATSTGTGGIARATSPTFVTPILGSGSYAALRTTEITATPSGTTQTITLGDGNHQTLSLASTTGNPTITLTVPTSSAAGTLILIQHGTTPRSITWAVSSGSILWMGGQPTWASDAVSTSRVISWRWNGSVMRLAATEVGA
jgi:hypothetical protein